jgi:hypothetical protein
MMPQWSQRFAKPRSAEDASFVLSCGGDVDGDVLTLTATLVDGGRLPAWLAFDGTQLTGTPPMDFNGYR